MSTNFQTISMISMQITFLKRAFSFLFRTKTNPMGFKCGEFGGYSINFSFLNRCKPRNSLVVLANCAGAISCTTNACSLNYGVTNIGHEAEKRTFSQKLYWLLRINFDIISNHEGANKDITDARPEFSNSSI